MISAAAVLPHPPLLLRANAGREPVAEDLRAACAATVRDLADRCESVVVVSGHPARPSTTLDPLGVRVAAQFLDEAGLKPAGQVLVRFDAGPEACAAAGRRAAADALSGRRAVGALVMADGSACRGPQAPGHLDPRAHGVDAVFAAAVRDGDAAALAALDPVLAREVWFQGRAALGVLASLVPRSVPRASVRYADDPFGVFYLVALWDFTPSSAPAGRR
jgi:hypothetical protein